MPRSNQYRSLEIIKIILLADKDWHWKNAVLKFGEWDNKLKAVIMQSSSLTSLKESGVAGWKPLKQSKIYEFHIWAAHLKAENVSRVWRCAR